MSPGLLQCSQLVASGRLRDEQLIVLSEYRSLDMGECMGPFQK